ncbi:MAG: SurA N-terminal domain-containing protein [Arenimonas sp.]|nr:SurA N-terminal domain-containing protein [Arenimonas sp.]MBP6625960.1 SurA N-terminal domain-containing protein [Arenimonas sp.]
MLQRIREKSSGWIAFVILGLVIITMAFFGIESYFAPKIETYAAKIEGPPKFMIWGEQVREVSQDEFRRRFEQSRAEERNRQGEAFDNAAFESLDNKRLVLDTLVDEQLLALVAERDGISVGEADVAKELKAMAEFQDENGVYSPDRYRLALAGQNMSHAQFMASVRADMARRTVPSQIVSSALASDAELEAFLSLSQQTRDLSVIDLPTPALPATPPTDAQLQAWYDANASLYRSEEKVAVEYVEIDGATLEAPVAADEASLRARYQELRSRYVTEPKRRASHILISAPADADDATDTAALARAVAVMERARAEGADFAALAREASDDLGSKADGGDLGVVEAGLFAPEFEQALFALEQPGQVADPVRTPDGWHVISLRELTPGSERPFEDVRAELEADYLATERDRVFSDLSGRLLEFVYKDPTALAPAAEAVGLPLKRSGLFGRAQGDGIAALPVVRDAAFSDSQRLERQVSDTLEIGPNHVVVIHVVEVQPEAALPLAEVRERVLADFNADRLAKASLAQAEALLARAKKGEELDALAAELGRTVAALPAVTRRGQLPPQLLDVAFRLPAPEGKTLGLGIAELTPDRHALVAVTAVRPGSLEALDAETRTRLREQLAQARGFVEYQDYVKSLRKHYTVTVAEARL